MNDCDINLNIAIPKRRCRYWRYLNQRKSIPRREERIVFKTGEFNIEKFGSRKCVDLPDLFRIFTEARWRWALLYCAITYVFNWFVFAIIWWIILYEHGDLEWGHMRSENNTTEWQPCVRETHSFTSIFLFSIEIHTTIGYGKRAITKECALAIFTMCLESIAGKILQSIIIGIIFAKFTRSKNRSQTLTFSKNLIVNQRDTHLSLIFKVGNVRKSRIIGVSVAAYLIKYERLDEDILNYDQLELKLDTDSNTTIFAYPITVLHVINKTSPFYNVSAFDMLKSRLEILVVIEGIIESTGQIVQAKTSYTNYDILWGRRFVNPIYYRKKKRGYVINYAKFDEIHRINTPLCTAKDLQEYYEFRKKITRTCPENLSFLPT